MQGEKGISARSNIIDNNILKSQNSTFDGGNNSSSLKSSEKKKLTEVFTLFNSLFFKQQRKENAHSNKSTTISKINKSQQKRDSGSTKLGGRSGGISQLIEMIVGGVALVAGAIPLIIGSIFKSFGTDSKFIGVLGKIGLWGALKLLAKTFLKFFAKPLLKRLPIIGSLISLYEAYQDFQDGKPVRGIMNIISAIAYYVPYVGPLLSLGLDLLIGFMDAKGSFEPDGAFSSKNAWGTIKTWAKGMWEKIWDNGLYLPIIGTLKRFSMASESFKSGDYGDGLKQIILGILSFGGGGAIIGGFNMLASFLSGRLSEAPKEITEDSSWTDRMVEWIRTKLKVLPWWIKKPLSWFGLIPDSMVGDIPEGYMTASGAVKEGINNIGNFAKSVLDKSKPIIENGVEIVSNFASSTGETVGELSEKAWNMLKSATPKIWDGIKSSAETTVGAIQKMGGWYMDGINSLSETAKTKIKEWAPTVVDVISGVADNALKVLKGIADKLGSWISKIFDVEITEAVESGQSSNVNNASNQNNANLNMFASNSNNQLMCLQQLQIAADRQVKLLEFIANISNASLKELKRMTGGGSGGGTNINISSPPSTSSNESNQLMKMADNRSGYSNSLYSL